MIFSVYIVVLLILSSAMGLKSILSTRAGKYRVKTSLYGGKNELPNWAGPYDLQLRSPCKLNLFLRILGRRPSGFHELASLFQAVSLSDDMHFSKLPVGASCDVMGCSAGNLPVDDSNLVIKALNLMRTKTGSIYDTFQFSVVSSSLCIHPMEYQLTHHLPLSDHSINSTHRHGECILQGVS